LGNETKTVPLGDSALLIQFGNEIDLEINQRVHALCLHGDNVHAATNARLIRDALSKNKILVEAI